MSEGGSPKRSFNLLSPFKRTLSRTDSQGSLSQTSDLPTTPKSGGGLFSSLKNGQQKRETIKELQEQVNLLTYDIQRKGQELQRLQQQLDAEHANSVGLKERLNMQFFKANLLVDMLVLRIIDTNGSQGPAAHAAAGR